MQTFSDENGVENARLILDDFVSAFVEFPKPLVALCNGPAIGIAATTVGLCDLVWASDSAYFLCPFTKIAQSAEGCSSETFPKIMGNAVANEMLVANTKLTVEEVFTWILISIVP